MNVLKFLDWGIGGQVALDISKIWFEIDNSKMKACHGLKKDIE